MVGFLCFEEERMKRIIFVDVIRVKKLEMKTNNKEIENMFKENNRYVTKAVNEEVDIRLQLIMWSIIDKLKDKGNVEVDYFQIFKIRKEENKIVINQSQEVPEHSCIYEIELEDIQIDDVIKVYVIDNGEYSNMLFSYEY